MKKTYKRNRSESLTIRLTSDEKSILKKRASVRGMSITDYIMLSSIYHSESHQYGHLLYTVEQMKSLILSVQERSFVPELFDLIDLNQQLYNEITNHIHKKDGYLE